MIYYVLFNSLSNDVICNQMKVKKNRCIIFGKEILNEEEKEEMKKLRGRTIEPSYLVCIEWPI